MTLREILEQKERQEPVRPNLLWLSIEQKGIYEGEKGRYYPEAGHFVVKGEEDTIMELFGESYNSRASLGKEIEVIHVDMFNRWEKRDGERILGITNPFKRLEEAFDILTGKPVSTIEDLKNKGWTYTRLWFVVVIKEDKVFGAVFQMRKTALARFLQFYNKARRKGFNKNLINITTKLVKDKAYSYYVPEFIIKPLENLPNEEKIVEVYKEYENIVKDYVKSFEILKRNIPIDNHDEMPDDEPDINF